MNKALRFHSEALEDLIAEAGYYEAQSRGLGQRFVNEVEAATRIAVEFPEMGAPFKYGTRRVFPKKSRSPSCTESRPTKLSCSPWQQMRASRAIGAIANAMTPNRHRSQKDKP